MSCFVSHLTVDCRDAFALSEFWRAVLGYVDYADDPNSPGDAECPIFDPVSGQTLVFVEVSEASEPPRAKNRLQLDLQPRAGRRDDEVQRLLSMGAILVADQRNAHGSGVGWITLADPEGNQFRVWRSPQERAAAP